MCGGFCDQARGWGERQSVARDYIFQIRPQLGSSRIGPDLTNLGARKPPYDADDLFWEGNRGLYFHYDDRGTTKIGWVGADGGKVSVIADDFGGTAMGRPAPPVQPQTAVPGSEDLRGAVP